MAWVSKLWVDAPNPLTPLSAAAMNDLEARIGAAATQADAFNLQPAAQAFNSANLTLTSGATVILTFDSNRFDSDSQHYTSAANLTGTVAKTAASAAIIGTGTLFTSQLSVGQIISVPGTATELRVVTSITDDTHLTVAGNFANTVAGQTAARDNSGIVARTAGVYDLLAGVEWAAGATGTRQLILQRVGVTGTTTTIAAVKDDASTTSVLQQQVMGIGKLAQWEFVRVVATHSQGANLNVTAAAEYSPFFAATRQAAG